MDYLAVEKYIRKHQLVEPGQKVVVGVSGGADSLTLLDCLAHLAYEPIIAHFDHQIREESGGEAEYVRAIGAQYNLPVVVGQGDVRSQSGGGIPLEEAARIARYRFLVEVSVDHSAQVIAVGHTADDQVETILMHLLRGAGSAGLSGMRPTTYISTWNIGAPKGMRLIRPLLFASRDDTVEHCHHLGLSPISDPSNQDPTFFRNRIRLELIPILESFNPGFRQVLLRTGELMQAEVDWLEQEVEAALEQVIEPAGDEAVRLLTAELKSHYLAVQRALLRRIMLGVEPGLRDISFDTIERLLLYLEREPPAGVHQLIGNLEMVPFGSDTVLRRRDAQIHLRGYPQVQALEPIELPDAGSIHLENHYELTMQRSPLPEKQELALERWLEERKSPWRVVLEADTLELPLRLRNRRPGDRFQPFGMQEEQKLSDFFINEKLPVCLRDRWPLIVTGSDQIAWVVGLRISEGHRVRMTSQQVLELEFNED